MWFLYIEHVMEVKNLSKSCIELSWLYLEGQEIMIIFVIWFFTVSIISSWTFQKTCDWFEWAREYESIRFLDGKYSKGHLLQGCLMSFSNAIAWAIRQHPLVLRIDLCIYLWEMIKKERAIVKFIKGLEHVRGGWELQWGNFLQGKL